LGNPNPVEMPQAGGIKEDQETATEKNYPTKKDSILPPTFYLLFRQSGQENNSTRPASQQEK